MNTIDLVRLYKRGSSAQRLWALVLLRAVKDGATEVWYDPDQGDSPLGYEIDGVKYDMVPPPEALQELLLQTVGDLLRPRSAWNLFAWLFSGAASRPVPVEGIFVAKVGVHGVTVSVFSNQERSRVVLRLSPETLAAPVARAALESVLRRR